MEANNLMRNENLEGAVDQLLGMDNEVRIDIENEGNQELAVVNPNIQQNHEQAVPNHLPMNNNLIVPNAGAGRINQQNHPENHGLQDIQMAPIQNNFPQGRARQPPLAMNARDQAVGGFPMFNNNVRRGHGRQPGAAIGARNQGALGLNQNDHEQQQFPHQIERNHADIIARNQEPLDGNQHRNNNQIEHFQGHPINLAHHPPARNDHENPEDFQNNAQGQFRQVNQNVANVQAGGQRHERVQDMELARDHGMQGFQVANNNPNVGQMINLPMQRQQPNFHAQHLQIPAGPQADVNINRQTAPSNYHSNRQNRHAPYMDMRGMSQNAKRMAMMVWSMAEAAMYVPSRFNNQPRNNTHERDDDDDDRSQYTS